MLGAIVSIELGFNIRWRLAFVSKSRKRFHPAAIGASPADEIFPFVSYQFFCHRLSLCGKAAKTCEFSALCRNLNSPGFNGHFDFEELWLHSAE